MKKWFIRNRSRWFLLFLAGFAQASEDWFLNHPADLPRLPAGERIVQYSSHDRSGANNDGFDGTYSSLFYEEGQYVLFDESGPGCIDRIWMTKISVTNRVRFFFDGGMRPPASICPLDRFSTEQTAFFRHRWSATTRFPAGDITRMFRLPIPMDAE
jgi:hypothetical protein